MQDKVEGFDRGADDYLVKPFSMIELEARIKALVRRARHQADRRRPCGSATSNSMRRPSRPAVPVCRFTSRRPASRSLVVLLREAPKLVSREVLEREVWGDDRPDSDALRTHIHALRAALDKPFDCADAAHAAERGIPPGFAGWLASSRCASGFWSPTCCWRSPSGGAWPRSPAPRCFRSRTCWSTIGWSARPTC